MSRAEIAVNDYSNFFETTDRLQDDEFCAADANLTDKRLFAG